MSESSAATFAKLPGLSAGASLVLGGARSGKSQFAEDLISSSNYQPVYLATGRSMDEEMSERISLHQERRGKDWQTVEEPLALGDALRQCAIGNNAVLVDCLTMWVMNLMMAEANVLRETDGLIELLPKLPAPVVFVSNEIGLGIVPDNAMSREFRDLAGAVNQQIAKQCGNAWFVAAGLPIPLKQANE